MFTLDLVRAFMKLEGFDIALIFDDLLGWVAHRLYVSPLSRSKSSIGFLLLWMFKDVTGEVADQVLYKLDLCQRLLVVLRRPCGQFWVQA